MDTRLRRATMFELVLLVVGIAIGVIGFYMINNLFVAEGALTWELLMDAFLWLILIVLLINAATMADVKEELAIVIREHIEETKLLKDIEHDMLKELRLLREDMSRKR
jgi:hypothetical protein